MLQVEDILLATWVLLLADGISRWTGDPESWFERDGAEAAFALGAPPGSGGWFDFVTSMPPAAWLLAALWLFLLVTRGPEDTSRERALERRAAMLGPAIPVMSIYALVASGIQRALGVIPVRRAGEEPPWPGPDVPRWVRRSAAVPLMLVGDSLFQAVLAGWVEYDTMTSFADLFSAWRLVGLAATVLPYALLVAGPRIAAGAELAWSPWFVRFAFLHAASWTHLWSRS